MKILPVILLMVITFVSVSFAEAKEIGSYEGSISYTSGDGSVFVIPLGTGNNESLCGNGIIERNEQCDGDLNGQICSSVVWVGSEGILSCSSACQWDVSNCTSIQQQTTVSNGNSGGSGGGGGSSIVELSVNGNNESNTTPQSAESPINISKEKSNKGDESGLDASGESGDTERNFFSSITGAAIGALGKRGIASISIILVVIGGIWLALRTHRTEATKKKSMRNSSSV